MKLVLIAVILTQLLATCVPPYDRPNAELPPVYRDQGAPPASPASIGDLGWWQLFKDPVLQRLLRTAVAANFDTLIAAQRIQEAEANLTIVASGRYPQVNAVLNAQYNRTNGQVPITSPRSTFAPNGLLTLQYEVDLFGRVRSATAAARAQVLESQFGREAIQTTLVSSVASLYFQVRELDEELRITRATLRARRQSLALVQARLTGGIGTLQDVRQAQQLVAQAAGYIPQIQLAMAQAENSISILIGAYPQRIPRGLPLGQQIAMPAIPAAGVPSALLERRPDIREAEEQLIAANAQIGVARALLYPQFTIGIGAGAGSTQVGGVGIASLLGHASTWYGQGFIQIVPQIVQQIFNAGAAHANVGLSQAEKQAALLQYVQSIHQGFGDVSNALIAYDDDRTYTVAETANAAAAIDATRLANLRFQGGITSYLEVLVSETQSYGAEIGLVQARLNERLALVQLYKALGGGWQAEPNGQAVGSKATSRSE